MVKLNNCIFYCQTSKIKEFGQMFKVLAAMASEATLMLNKKGLHVTIASEADNHFTQVMANNWDTLMYEGEPLPMGLMCEQVRDIFKIPSQTGEGTISINKSSPSDLRISATFQENTHVIVSPSLSMPIESMDTERMANIFFTAAVDGQRFYMIVKNLAKCQATQIVLTHEGHDSLRISCDGPLTKMSANLVAPPEETVLEKKAKRPVLASVVGKPASVTLDVVIFERFLKCASAFQHVEIEVNATFTQIRYQDELCAYAHIQIHPMVTTKKRKHEKIKS